MYSFLSVRALGLSWQSWIPFSALGGVSAVLCKGTSTALFDAIVANERDSFLNP